MPTYLEYDLDDGTTVLVQISNQETRSGLVQAGNRRGEGDSVIVRVNRKLSEALAGVKAQAATLRKQLEDLKADDVEVKFALKTTGELGNFAVGNIGVEANYEVTLKWKNAASPSA